MSDHLVIPSPEVLIIPDPFDDDDAVALAAHAAAADPHTGYHLESVGYLYGGTLYYIADDTFDKADHPGLRAIKAKCQGAGGGASGCGTTAAGQCAMGFAGHGGGYAESFILVADLDTSEAITVGAGGAGGVGANAGTNGGDSIFDTISGEVRGVGGTGGLLQVATAAYVANNGNQTNGGTGDLVIYGEASARYLNPPVPYIQQGCRSHLGAGGVGDVGANGGAGQGWGGGGGSTANGPSVAVARNGGGGANGIVIVELYF